MPTLLLLGPLANEKYLPKVVPASIGVVHYEGACGVSWALNLSIVIVWIYFRLVGLVLLSVGLRPALSSQNRPKLGSRLPFQMSYN